MIVTPTDETSPPAQPHHKHIVKSYDDDLTRLNDMLSVMGAQVQRALGDALKALECNDGALAREVIAGEAAIDRQENAIENFATRILALRQPVAQDLRYVLTAVKISAHLERIADYVEHIATRQAAVADHIQHYPVQLKALLAMGQGVNTMLEEALQSFMAYDTSLAIKVWRHDDVVDALYAQVMEDMIHILTTKPQQASVALHLLFLAKNIERMGDHITNIVENVYYLVEGVLWKEAFVRVHDVRQEKGLSAPF